MARLPFGERVLFDSPALSSSPGQDPTTKTGSCTIRKALPPATSAIACMAESTPKPGTSATRCTAS